MAKSSKKPAPLRPKKPAPLRCKKPTTPPADVRAELDAMSPEEQERWFARQRADLEARLRANHATLPKATSEEQWRAREWIGMLRVELLRLEQNADLRETFETVQELMRVTHRRRLAETRTTEDKFVTWTLKLARLNSVTPTLERYTPDLETQARQVGAYLSHVSASPPFTDATRARLEEHIAEAIRPRGGRGNREVRSIADARDEVRKIFGLLNTSDAYAVRRKKR